MKKITIVTPQPVRKLVAVTGCGGGLFLQAEGHVVFVDRYGTVKKAEGVTHLNQLSLKATGRNPIYEGDKIEIQF